MNDGIPIEFYEKFWPLISDCFIRCVNDCFEKGEMSHSQKNAFITLIEKKKGKDRSLIENWRPISLVNVDAKMMSKVIASRIKNVLPHITIKQGILITIRSIYDIMDWTVKENIPGFHFQKVSR